MSTPTIPAGNLFMNATLYTGNSSTQTITNGVAGQSFQPDFVWAKSRTYAYSHMIFDSIRGANQVLASNNTAVDTFVSGTLTSFNSNGFTVGANENGNYTSGGLAVAWQWKAGGTAVSNTNGSITSSVSANTTSGFSVVTWTNPASGTPTIGHGLSVAPTFIIVKDRTYAYNWDVGCTSIGWANRLNLNTTSTTSSGFWNSTAPTSTVFTYASSGANSGDSIVAYCWAPIAGYSAFGSYTGNGSADGPFVYLGFRPRFIMFKCSSNSGNWDMLDTSRNTYNVANYRLLAESSGAEITGAGVDIVSNGFKIRNTDTSYNGSGQVYIYMAFAETPLKFSNAR